MTVSLTDALAAYRNAANALGNQGPEPAKEGGADFSNLVKDAIGTAANSMARGEKLSAQSVAGKAELTDVVTAVTSAELTLQTVVAVRDRVISAYQEIMRMPI
jgi:flagellar hook-basal body complex protein FliE